MTYNLEVFKLPPGPESAAEKPAPAPPAGRNPGNASTGGYDLSVFNLPPKTGPQSPAVEARTRPTIRAGSNPGNDSGGYDLSSFHLPETVEIPNDSVDGKQTTERILVKDFGRHVRAQVEAGLSRSPQGGAVALFRAIGCAQGGGLMSGPTLKRFEELGQGFLSSKNPKLFFARELMPFLNGLIPGEGKKR